MVVEVVIEQIGNTVLAVDWTLPLAQQADPSPPGFGNLLLPIAAIMLLFYFLILKPQKNKEQAMREMLGNLKERDRVITIGGIHGVVTNVLRDKEEVSIRVDEATGAKLRVNTSAIARVITDDEKAET